MAWGAGLRKVAERAGVDRKTARRYVEAAQAAGLVREAGVPVDEAVTDVLIGLVVEAVRPARPSGHGESWERQSPETVETCIGRSLGVGVPLLARGPRPESGSRLAGGHPEGLALTPTRRWSRWGCDPGRHVDDPGPKRLSGLMSR